MSLDCCTRPSRRRAPCAVIASVRSSVAGQPPLWQCAALSRSELAQRQVDKLNMSASESDGLSFGSSDSASPRSSPPTSRCAALAATISSLSRSNGLNIVQIASCRPFTKPVAPMPAAAVQRAQMRCKGTAGNNGTLFVAARPSRPVLYGR